MPQNYRHPIVAKTRTPEKASAREERRETREERREKRNESAERGAAVCGSLAEYCTLCSFCPPTVASITLTILLYFHFYSGWRCLFWRHGTCTATCTCTATAAKPGGYVRVKRFGVGLLYNLLCSNFILKERVRGWGSG